MANKTTKKAAKKKPVIRSTAARAGDTTDPLAIAAKRARSKPQVILDDPEELDDPNQDDPDQDELPDDPPDDVRQGAGDVPDYVTEAIDKQRAFANDADGEIFHLVYKHLGGTRHGARELAGRVMDVDVLEQADVADRFGGGFYTIYSYFRRNGAQENRVAWTCRVSANYTATRPAASRVAPGVALPSQLAESVALLDQLSVIAERLGGGRREPSPVEAMGKMMESVMQVLGTTMRTAVKVQGDRALEQLREAGAPAALPAAPPPAHEFGLKDLFDSVGGLEGIMNLWGQLKKGQGAAPGAGDAAP